MHSGGRSDIQARTAVDLSRRPPRDREYSTDHD